MSIYHFGQMKVISRASGRSAVGASAYISGEKLKNEYDGITHDYTKKQGVVFDEVMLPQNAPKEFENRETLWNEIEKIEKSKNSQLARSFEVGLQTEFTLEENIKLIRSYVKNNFIDKGMCADICIHDKGDGNPHAHVMLTMRKLDEQGKFLPKAQKEYLCRDTSGKEKYLSAKELKENKNFEKVFRCRDKNKHENLTSSQLKKEEYKNYKKISKDAIDRKIDMCADWNNKNNVELWREDWAKVNNELFKEKGLDIRIDHRSYERQELDMVPTIHEGYGARLRVKRGKESDRVDINKYIKSINEKIKEYEMSIQKIKNEIIQVNKEVNNIKKLSREEIKPSESHSKPMQNSLRESIQQLKEKLPQRANKYYGIDKALMYMDKRGINTIDDVRTLSNKILNIKIKLDDKIEKVNNYIHSMEQLYDKILTKTREIKSLENEVGELGIFKFKQKKELNERIDKLKNEINELKESEFFQRDSKYSDKLAELKGIKEDSISILRSFDDESHTLYDIETLNKYKENILKSLDRDKSIDVNIKRHSHDLEL